MTHAPYLAPKTSNPATADAPHDLRWRAAVWFAAPLVALIFAFILMAIAADGGVQADTLRVPFEMMLCVALPAGVAGYGCGHRCRASGWTRYLALACRDAMAWAVYASLLIWMQHDASPRTGMKRLGRAAMITVTLCLLLSSTFRARFHRRA
jgi:hypothetical protein